MQWHIGCSGFSYDSWKGIFYPAALPPNEWFEYYANQFDTLELNASFYRLPNIAFFKNLYNGSPAHFSFVVKAPKQITHVQQFEDAHALLNNFYETICHGLGKKLGAALFQLPPSFHFTPERLEKIINNLDENIMNVVEFRHRSWWQQGIVDKLGDNNITFCGASYPALPNDVIINTPTPYYRFHGAPTIYYSMYGEIFLKAVADKISKHKNVQQAFLLFNNTATRAALENASFLQEYVML